MTFIPTPLVVAGALLIGLLPHTATAGGHAGHHAGKRHGKHLLMNMIRAAQPTPEQRAKLKALRASWKAQRKAMVGKHGMAIGQALAAAVASGDEDELDAAFAQKQQRMQQRQRNHLQRLKAVLSIMTEDQRARMAAVMKRMQQKRRQHAKRRHKKRQRRWHKRGGKRGKDHRGRRHHAPAERGEDAEP